MRTSNDNLEMAPYMKKLLELYNKEPITQEELNLFSVGYKNRAGHVRASHRLYNSILGKTRISRIKF